MTWFNRFAWSVAAAASLPLFVSCAQRKPAGPPGARTAALRPADEQTAVRIAEAAIREKNLRTDDRLYYVQSERFRDKPPEAETASGGGGGAREGVGNDYVVVTHYRYAGDTTIRTLVNLTSQTAERVETAEHVPTALSQAEFETAKRLAFQNDAVRAATGGERAAAPAGGRGAGAGAAGNTGVVVEALVSHTSAKDDPQFGHRVVRLLFRRGRDYLTDPVVTVDLTTQKVMVTPSQSEMEDTGGGHDMREAR